MLLQSHHPGEPGVIGRQHAGAANGDRNGHTARTRQGAQVVHPAGASHAGPGHHHQSRTPEVCCQRHARSPVIHRQHGDVCGYGLVKVEVEHHLDCCRTPQPVPPRHQFHELTGVGDHNGFAAIPGHGADHQGAVGQQRRPGTGANLARSCGHDRRQRRLLHPDVGQSVDAHQTPRGCAEQPSNPYVAQGRTQQGRHGASW